MQRARIFGSVDFRCMHIQRMIHHSRGRSAMKPVPKLSAIVLLAASSIASAQTVLDHSKMIPPQPLSWVAFPESTSFTDGIKVVKPDDSDPSVAAYLNVEYAKKSGMPLHVTLLTPSNGSSRGVLRPSCKQGEEVSPTKLSRCAPTRPWQGSQAAIRISYPLIAVSNPLAARTTQPLAHDFLL